MMVTAVGELVAQSDGTCKTDLKRSKFAACQAPHLGLSDPSSGLRQALATRSPTGLSSRTNGLAAAAANAVLLRQHHLFCQMGQAHVDTQQAQDSKDRNFLLVGRRVANFLHLLWARAAVGSCAGMPAVAVLAPVVVTVAHGLLCKLQGRVTIPKLQKVTD